MGAHDAIAGPLASHLIDVASDRGPDCTVEDLSGSLMLSAQELALECYRRGFGAGFDAGRDAALETAPTGVWRRPEAETVRPPAPARASGVLPAGLFDGDTPPHPVSVEDVLRSRGG